MSSVTWEADKLGRREESQFLTNYLLSRFSQDEEDRSLVINLNAERGMGKTYFLNNWSNDLAGKRHPVIRFNAWENDFSGEPLLGLLSELETTLSGYLSNAPKAKSLLTETVNKAKRLIKPSEPMLTSLLTSTFHGLSRKEMTRLISLENQIQDNPKNDADEEYFDLMSKIMPAAAEEALKNYKAKKESIRLFRDCLKKLVAHLDTEMKSVHLPIFIFIDELDRCRPDYTIELLEKIRHLLAVDGVYIVIATDTDQLVESIKFIYGNNTDTDRALKQFFDQQYNLAKPQKYQFAEYLFHKHKLDQENRFFTPLSIKFSVTRNVHMDIFAIMTKYFSLSLGDQEQVCATVKAICLTWTLEKKIHLPFLLFLLMLQQRSPELYHIYSKASQAERLSILKSPDYQSLVNNNVVIKTSMPSRDGFHAPHEKERLTSIMQRYTDYLGKSMPQIADSNSAEYEVYQAIREQLIAGMPEQYNPESPPRHELGRYFDCVHKASHLILR